MAGATLLDIIKSLFRLPTRMNLAGFHSQELFQALLKRECALSDRSNRSFSLLILDFDDRRSLGATLRKLSRILEKRLRTSDEVGFFDERRIGVLLSDTNLQGALIVARSICEAMESLGKLVHCVIYMYPSKWLDDDSGGMNPNDPNESEDYSTDVFGSSNSKISVGEKSIDSLIQSCMPIWKRMIDITGALVLLILLFPVMLVIVALIKCVSPGPAFFKQQRVGFHGMLFTCWKFRTMRPNAETDSHSSYFSGLIHSDAPMVKLDSNDDRIIPFGKVLRKSGLDELPQLINILKGEMSLVGPRPSIPYEAKQFFQWQRRRFSATPGLTGLWQVKGKNQLTFEEMLRYDIKYSQKRSLWLDLSIFFKTLPAVYKQFSDGSHSRKKKSDKSTTTSVP